MARYERPRRNEGSDRRSGGRRSFGNDRGNDRRGGGGRGFGGERREVEMTRVTCSECGDKCEVPFKPTSSKPVYCSDCFSNKERSSGGDNYSRDRRSSRDNHSENKNRHSERDLDIINEKLNKIMKALDIN